MKVYRIAQRSYIDDLSGEGARLFGGRWNHKGIPLLYTAESRSLAALEILVHAHNLSSISSLAILVLEIPDSIKIDDYANKFTLPDDWNKYPALSDVQDRVEDWIKSNGFILKVPSAIIKEESNYLINPKHKNMSDLKIIDIQEFSLDERLQKIKI